MVFDGFRHTYHIRLPPNRLPGLRREPVSWSRDPKRIICEEMLTESTRWMIRTTKPFNYIW